MTESLSTQDLERMVDGLQADNARLTAELAELNGVCRAAAEHIGINADGADAISWLRSRYDELENIGMNLREHNYQQRAELAALRERGKVAVEVQSAILAKLTPEERKIMEGTP